MSVKPRVFASLLLVATALLALGSMPQVASAEDNTSPLAAAAAAEQSGASDTSPSAPSAPAAATDASTASGAAPGATTHTKPRALRTPKPKRRGGLNPCMTPDPGFGLYDGWSTAPTVGQMIAPRKGGLTKSGGFDLVVHFHGHEPIRKEFVKTGNGVVLVGIDLGIGSGAYSNAFASPYVFDKLLESVEAEMSRRSGKKARIRHLALSSWSAGYGAVEQILQQPAGKKVEALILLDSVHTGYIDEGQRTLKTDQLAPFVAFAARAAKKQTFMYMSHSSIIPPGYASTDEVADYVVSTLKGKPKKASRKDVLGLDLYERFDKGDFHMRGYTGNDKPDHCAHIGLMADVMKTHLVPRWKTPKAKK
jgi:hypothetical protein